MKTLVIMATHHGAFLTIQSAKEIFDPENIIVLIPRSQIEKYEGFYQDNKDDPEYLCFKNYEQKIKDFSGLKTYVIEDIDINNPVSSISECLMALELKGLAFVVGAGTLVLKDPFTDYIKENLETKRVGISANRVYHENPRLNMYQMLGLGNHNGGVDGNVFVLNLDLFDRVYRHDHDLLIEKRFWMDREYNMKSDYLIGTAISARESVQHGVRAIKSYIINFWSVAMKKYDTLYPEETFSYPLDYYSAYAEKVKDFLPISTYEKILENGEKTKYWIEEIRSILS